MKAVDVLRNEHNVIKRVLDCFARVIDSGGTVERDDLHKLVHFFNEYADRGHHSKEDRIFFPLIHDKDLRPAGCSLKDLLIQHDQGRGVLEDMQADLAAWAHNDPAAKGRFFEHAKQYRQILLKHIQLEDECLFPTAQKVLTEAEDRELMLAFDESDERETGSGTTEKLEAIVNELCGKWLQG